MTSDYILKIYRMSIPHMPKTAIKFGNDLQLLLQPMVLKPNPQAGLGVRLHYLPHEPHRLKPTSSLCRKLWHAFVLSYNT